MARREPRAGGPEGGAPGGYPVASAGSLHGQSARELAAAIRRGETSARDVLEAHVERILRVNPALNAVVADRFAAARAEADAADRAPDELRTRPLHGVPFTVKECFAVEGMPNSSGLLARRHVRASKDATAVARLRAAGAIPMGVTNVSELCMWMESHNRVYGLTRNPHDPGRTAGGSSGGEGAIVAAGGSPFGLGSDIGGSLRMPAFFNGVFTHKPSGGLVPGTGQYPMAHGAARRYLATGPICRRAEDLMPLVAILAGPDGVDTGCEPMTLGDPASVDVGTLSVLDVRGNGAVGVARELLEAQARAARHLASLGANVTSTTLPLLRRSFDIWAARMASAGGPAFAEMLGDGTPVRGVPELVRWAMRRSPHTLPSIVLALLERLQGLTAGRTRRALRDGAALEDELRGLLGDGCVMLYPSYPSPAPRHGRPLMPPFQWVYTAIWNAMELPATQVPLGLGARGLPLGVQVVAGHGRDHLGIAVALELERELGGWTPAARFGP